MFCLNVIKNKLQIIMLTYNYFLGFIDVIFLDINVSLQK